MRTLKRFCLAALALAASQAANAGGPTGGIFGGYYAIGPHDPLQSDVTLVARVGYDILPVFSIEAEMGFLQDKTRLQQYYYDALTPRLNFLIAPDFGFPEKVKPFIAFGPGFFYRKVHRVPVGEESNEDGWGNYKNPDTDFQFNIGPGVKYWIGSFVYLRTDFRFIYLAGNEPLGTRPDQYSHWEWTLGIGFGQGDVAKDTDEDGILDKVDECIDDKEDFDKYQDEDGCPEDDNDKDGINDARDECPDDPEDPDGFEDRDGCPEEDNDEDGLYDVQDNCPNEFGPEENEGCPITDFDSDGDGLLDSEDACPDEPGPRSARGCPDRDADHVPDKRDECPDVPGNLDADPERSNGCPSRVVVTRDKIMILEKVYFEYNKAIIKKESYGLLDDVAAVLLEYPDLQLVEVAGHTDGDGGDDYNLELSQARAESVRNFLIAAGVEESRLTAKGYGESMPVDSNATEAGKANNRRVEFTILQREE